MCKHIWERSHRCGNLDMKENSLLPWLQADFQQNTSQTNLLAAKDACTEVRQKSTWLQSCVVTCSFHLDYVIVETNGKLTGIFCIFLSWKKSYPRSKKQYEKSLNCARSQNYRKKASRSLLTDGQGGSVVRVRARKAGGLRSRPIWKERAPQMLVGWVRFPVGSDRRLEKRYCLSSLVLSVNGRVQGKVNARCWHWLATSAAFTAKVAAWPTAQVSGEWGSRPLQIKDYKASSIFFLSITIKKQWNQKYWTDKATRLLAWNTNWSTDIADLPSVTTAWWSSRTMTSAASARSPAGRGTDESRCRTRAQCGPRTARWCRFYCTTDKTWVLFSVKHPSRLKHGRAVQTHKRFWELLYYLVRFAPLVWFFLLAGGQGVNWQGGSRVDLTWLSCYKRHFGTKFFSGKFDARHPQWCLNVNTSKISCLATCCARREPHGAKPSCEHSVWRTLSPAYLPSFPVNANCWRRCFAAMRGLQYNKGQLTCRKRHKVG